MPVVLLVFGFALTTPPVSAQGPWPGQAGNAVGYAAAPGWPGAFNTTACPSSPKSGTSWADATVISNCTYSSSGGTSTSCNYCIFEYVDFINTTIATTNHTLGVGADHEMFIGDRFQSNAIQGGNVASGHSDVWFLYDSFVPLASFYTTPPGMQQWPGAGAGANSTSMSSSNSVATNKGYEFGLEIFTGASMVIDHCDIWGYGNAIAFQNNVTTGNTLTNNWIHDTAEPDGVTGGQYHSDGIGYLNGGAAPNNVTIVGNAVGMLGNTNALALQAASSGYQNITVAENFWSGDGATVSWCRPGSVPCTNSSFYGNTFGTDVEPGGPLYSPGASLGTGTVWACNTIEVLPGTTWTNFANGEFFLNASPENSTRDEGGNTLCAITAPAAINFGKQAVSSSSNGQTITLSNTNTDTLSISSITLASGQHFSIASNSCGSTLSSGATCSIAVKFSPTSAGPHADTLKIVDNTPGVTSPQLVPLVGFAAGSSGASAPTPPTSVTATVN
jgi:hypothetical protein